MSKIYPETGEVIAITGGIATLIWEAVRAKGIEVTRPEEFRTKDRVLQHFYLDMPLGSKGTCRVMVLPPKAGRSA